MKSAFIKNMCKAKSCKLYHVPFHCLWLTHVVFTCYALGSTKRVSRLTDYITLFTFCHWQVAFTGNALISRVEQQK